MTTARVSKGNGRVKVSAEIKQGNTAALRRALEDTLYLAKKYIAKSPATSAVVFENGKPVREIDYLQTVKNAETALAAPPRNCDVGTAEEQEERYDAFCAWHYGTNDMSRDNCRICPLSPMGCKLAWAQMPYKEEVAK